MLNPYFAFGVPIFLLFLYVVFAIIRKKVSRIILVLSFIDCHVYDGV